MDMKPSIPTCKSQPIHAFGPRVAIKSWKQIDGHALETRWDSISGYKDKFFFTFKGNETARTPRPWRRGREERNGCSPDGGLVPLRPHLHQTLQETRVIVRLIPVKRLTSDPFSLFLFSLTSPLLHLVFYSKLTELLSSFRTQTSKFFPFE